MKIDTLEGLNEVRQVLGKKIVRTLALDRSAIDEGARTVKIAFSSELPVERYFGYEILDHDPGSVDLTRVPGGMAFLLQHDPDKQVGVIEEVSIDPDRVGRSTVRLSQNAEDIWTDIKDGIRRNISVGYEITGILSEDVAEDGKPRFRFKWSPIEISLVAVPADYTVGVGRSLESDQVPPEGEPPVPEVAPLADEAIQAERSELEEVQDATPSTAQVEPTPAPEPRAEETSEPELPVEVKKYDSRDFCPVKF